MAAKKPWDTPIVEEIIAPDNRGQWLRPLENCKDPIDALIGTVQELSVQAEAVRGGCPLVNLAQQMSHLDAGFRQRLATIIRDWQDGVAAALQDGQKHGKVRRDLEPAQAAGVLIAMVEGYGMLAKNAQDAKVMKDGIRKHRGVAAVFTPAGQSQAGLKEFVYDGLTIVNTNQSVYSVFTSGIRTPWASNALTP